MHVKTDDKVRALYKSNPVDPRRGRHTGALGASPTAWFQAFDFYILLVCRYATVVVIAGADKGKVTSVVEVFTKSGEILCKDVNVKTKHVKPKGEGETGQIIQRWGAHITNYINHKTSLEAAQDERSRPIALRLVSTLDEGVWLLPKHLFFGCEFEKPSVK
jgi:ribosomal protein L24